jgi:hypothetical protein
LTVDKAECLPSPTELYSPWKNTGTHWIGGWLGTRASLKVFCRKEASCVPTEILTPDRSSCCLVVIPTALILLRWHGCRKLWP